MKEDQRNYLLVGIFVIAMVVGLVAWIGMVSGRAGSTVDYYIRYGSVLGLKEGTQVYFDGYPVGLIDRISYVTDGDPQPFRLDVAINDEWRIPEDSQAEITASGLLSAVVINIAGGASTTMLDPGDRITSAEPVNLMDVVSRTASNFSDFLVDVLRPQIESIVADLRGTMDQVNVVLSPENAERISSILVNLESVSANVDDFASGLGTTRRRLDQVIASTGKLIDSNEADINQSIDDLQETLEAMARHAEAIAQNLEVTTRNMNEISRQVRENPGVLLRGREARDDPAVAP
jgi:phospholipid/cholesterol/gamma-HCH transport system substrate-binding protein